MIPVRLLLGRAEFDVLRDQFGWIVCGGGELGAFKPERSAC